MISRRTALRTGTFEKPLLSACYLKQLAEMKLRTEYTVKATNGGLNMCLNEVHARKGEASYGWNLKHVFDGSSSYISLIRPASGSKLSRHLQSLLYDRDHAKEKRRDCLS